MNKIWAIEAVAIVLILGVEPTADAVNIPKITKVQYTTWIVEHLSNYNLAETITSVQTKKTMLKEIEETKNKNLAVNKTLGFRHVMYWEHEFNDMFLVKNDSMHIHIDTRSNELIYYRRQWTNVDVNVSNFIENEFEPKNFYWKQLVIFPDEDDCKDFYSFNQTMQYPVVCWEVRYKDGTTVMYDGDGEPIGKGVPAPSYEAFSLSGYDKGTPHNPWNSWRANADKWFRKWFSNVISKSLPSNEEVSRYISDPNITYFYEIAHSGGEPTRFQTNGDKVFYTVNELNEDMANREPMTLAVLCSCEAMRDTGPGTLSYGFRKGETKDTITIGYVGMGGCPGWYDSLDWQECLFLNIDRGFTIKNAFDLACSLFPRISDCVVFVGDEKIRLNEPDIIDQQVDLTSPMSIIVHVQRILQTTRVGELIKKLSILSFVEYF
jgi:hypothetical protein